MSDEQFDGRRTQYLLDGEEEHHDDEGHEQWPGIITTSTMRATR